MKRGFKMFDDFDNIQIEDWLEYNEMVDNENIQKLFDEIEDI